jgi:hypothetical protein
MLHDALDLLAARHDHRQASLARRLGNWRQALDFPLQAPLLVAKRLLLLESFRLRDCRRQQVEYQEETAPQGDVAGREDALVPG